MAGLGFRAKQVADRYGYGHVYGHFCHGHVYGRLVRPRPRLRPGRLRSRSPLRVLHWTAGMVMGVLEYVMFELYP